MVKKVNGRLHVAMIIQDFLPRGGGAERQIASLAPLLKALGVEISVLTRHYPGMPRYEVLRGIPVQRLPAPGPKYFAGAIYILGMLVSLMRDRPDIIHAHGLLSPAASAVIAKYLLGIPVIAKVLRGGPLGDIDRIRDKPFSKIRSKLLSKGVDIFLAISQEIDRELDRLGVPEERRIRIPNGVDTDRFGVLPASGKQAAKSSLGLPDAPVVIYTGRLVPEKRVDLLVEIWNDVRSVHPDAHLYILGTGEQETQLRDSAGSGIVFVGYTDDVPAYLAAADIYVLPSETEGLPNSLLEAMSAGLAVVATSVGGTPDVIEHGVDGLLVEPGNSEMLRSALVKLLGDDSLRQDLGRSARQKVVSSYSLPVIAERLREVYDFVTDNEFVSADQQLSHAN